MIIINHELNNKIFFFCSRPTGYSVKQLKVNATIREVTENAQGCQTDTRQTLAHDTLIYVNKMKKG